MWVDRKKYKLFPNVYTVLVGTPGTGKGNSVLPVLSLLKEANTAHILTDNLTMPYVLEQLANGFPVQVISNNGNSAAGTSISFGQESSCIVVAEELSVFIKNPDYDLPNLNSLWIGQEGTFQYGTRGKGLYEITSPCQSLLAGTATDYLGRCLPSSAVGGGFTRRVNFVYSRQQPPSKPWPMAQTSLDQAIINDLRHIAQLRGEFTFARAARPLFEQIYRASTPDDFDDEATANYKTSLWAHATKVAMCLSAARDDSRVISQLDLDTAYDRIQREVLKNLTVVFRSVGESDMASVTNRIISLIEKHGYVTERQLLQANYKHVSKDDLAVILTTLKTGGVIYEKSQAGQVIYAMV